MLASRTLRRLPKTDSTHLPAQPSCTGPPTSRPNGGFHLHPCPSPAASPAAKATGQTPPSLPLNPRGFGPSEAAATFPAPASVTPNPDGGARGAAAAFRDADLPLTSPCLPSLPAGLPFSPRSCLFPAGGRQPAARGGGEQEPSGKGARGALKQGGGPASCSPNRLGHRVPLGSYGPMSSPGRLSPNSPPRAVQNRGATRSTRAAKPRRALGPAFQPITSWRLVGSDFAGSYL